MNKDRAEAARKLAWTPPKLRLLTGKEASDAIRLICEKAETAGAESGG